MSLPSPELAKSLIELAPGSLSYLEVIRSAGDQMDFLFRHADARIPQIVNGIVEGLLLSQLTFERHLAAVCRQCIDECRMIESAFFLEPGLTRLKARLVPFGSGILLALEVAEETGLRIGEPQEQIRQPQKINDLGYFMEDMMQSIPDVIVVMDVPTRELLYFNHEASGITGVPLSALFASATGEYGDSIIHADDRMALENYYKLLEEHPDNTIVTVNYRFRKNAGDYSWFHLRGKVFCRNAQGRPLQTLHIGNNATDQMKAAAQAREQLHFITQVAITLPDMLSVIELGTLKVEYANKDPFLLNGFDADEISAMTREERTSLIHPDSRDDMTAYFEHFRNYNDKEIQTLEYRARTKEGWQWFRVRGKVFNRDNEGRASHCVNIVQNIHRQKMAEEELIALKLEQQKQVLNTILLTQEQERERIGEALHNGVGQLLYAIQTHLQRLNVKDEQSDKLRQEIIDIVTIAIKDTRNISFELVPVILREHGVEVALRTLLQRMGSDRLGIRLNYRGSRRRLSGNIEFSVYRIVQELVANVVKHSRASRASVDLSFVRQSLILEVCDNGVGFKEELSAATLKGIGMQSVRNRVNLLNGTMKIVSVPGNTSVLIHLPVHKPDALE